MNNDINLTPLEEEQTLSKETVAKLLNEKSMFMGKLVHNLKNPVGSALSFSEMILDDVDSYTPEKLKRHLNIIKTSCEAAIVQLEMLLIEAKIEANNLELFLQETLFSELIQNYLNDNQIPFQKSNIQITVNYLINEPKILLDRSLIKSAIQGIFQFILSYGGNNNSINISLGSNNNLLDLSIMCSQCANCDQKIEEFNQTVSQEKNILFKSKQEKILNLKTITAIAKVHNGFFTIQKDTSNTIAFSLAISQNL